MTERKHMALRRFTSLEEMKAEEYRYWQSRPGHERMQAVYELTQEMYAIRNASADAPRLQRTLVRVKR
jgi:hypothetical protein